MKTYKIYGVAYKLKSKPAGVIDTYAYKGQLVDDMPSTKLLGYVKMEDGSIVECHDALNILLIILPIIIILILGGAGFAIYALVKSGQPPVLEVDDATGTTITTEGYSNICSYQGFMTADDNHELNVEFQNGDFPATILVEGDGIETKETQVPAKGYVATIPVNVTSKNAVINAKIIIRTSDSTASYDVVIEVPGNNNGNDTNDGFSGAWSREDVYISPAEADAMLQREVEGN